MALPTYDKSKRKKQFEMLPKGAYVIIIKNAVEESNRNKSGSHLTISFDIAEGEYKDFYMNQWQADTREDRKWNRDAVYYLTVPYDGCQQFVWDNWNTFFADLEDSNNGFVFGGGDPKTLKGKVIGGKFANVQSEWNGQVYDHTQLRWTCVAEDVRQGKAGKMPPDKLKTPSALIAGAGIAPETGDDWMKIPEGIEEDLPFA